MHINDQLKSKMVSDQNFINIKIAYKNLILIAFTSCISLISCLCILFYKLSIAYKSIEQLEQKHEALNLAIKEFYLKNEKLLESLTNLTLQNQRLQKIVEDLQLENSALLETTTRINLTKLNTFMYIDQNTLLQIVLGLTVIGVVTYSGFTLVNFINAKYANSSIGLLLAGIDKHLIWLGERTNIITKSEITQTLVDQFSYRYIVELRGGDIVNILIDDHNNLIEIGSYINNLLSNVNSQQALVDVLTGQVSTLSAQLPVAVVNATVNPAALMLENAARLSSIV